MKQLIIVLILLFSIFSCTSNESKAGNSNEPPKTQSDGNTSHTCDFSVTISFPQLVTGKKLTETDIQILLLKAKTDGIILDNRTVLNREKLADLVLLLLKRQTIGIAFGSAPTGGAVLIGYIIEIIEKDVPHFILAGEDKKPLYNPCKVLGPIHSIQEVFVFTR
jgi:hypothetical protein